MTDGPTAADRPAVSPPPTAGDAGRRRAVTALAFGCLALPFAVVTVRFLAFGGRVDLADDLALIDLHTRVALRWQQAVGPFDRFGWNHPGPAYFYLLTLPYRLLGSGARAAFVGATLLNAASCLGVVWAVHRRRGPRPALWAALCVGVLALQMSFSGPASSTFSEGPLGALVSPWNPMVVVLPMVLLAVLGAAAAEGSGLSALGAVLVGSYLVQTDVSTAPLVVVLLLASLVAAAVTRRRAAGPPRVGRSGAGARRSPHRSPWGVGLALVGSLALVAMWVPPVVQQVTGHPGNLTLLWDFFRAPHTGHPLSQAWWAVVAADGMTLLGPSELLHSVLGHPPHLAALATLTLVLATASGAAAAALGWRRHDRFGGTLGGLSLVGLMVSLAAVTRITGLIFGYLVLWEVALPVVAVVGLGVVLWGDDRPIPIPDPTGAPGAGSPASAGGPGTERRRAGATAGLCALAVVVTVALCVRMVALPSLTRVDDPGVSATVALVVPALGAGPVFVGDEGLPLLETEQFVGVVNRLDELGRLPRVNDFWIAQFGPGYLADGAERTQIALAPWTPGADSRPGYRGRVGDIAVLVTRGAPPAGE